MSDSERGVVDVLFRDPPIFEKVCARVVAERNGRARRAYVRGEYALAESLYQVSYREAGGYGSFAGYLGSAYTLGRFDSIVTSYEGVVVRSGRPLQYLPFFLTIGDAFWIAGETERAGMLFESVRTANITNTTSAINRKPNALIYCIR